MAQKPGTSLVPEVRGSAGLDGERRVRSGDGPECLPNLHLCEIGGCRHVNSVCKL